MIVKHYPWHEKSWQQLLSVNKLKRLHHGLLLVDKPGRGVLEFANALAAKLLCEAEQDVACGKCKACLLQQNNNHPDYRLLEPEEEGKPIKVDQVRAVIDFFSLTSHAQQNKVVVIEPADAMNRNAANGLLKVLEEPPANAVIMLVTSNDALLPITIRSRCQKIHLGQNINIPRMHDWLKTQIENEHLDELLQLMDYEPLTILDEGNSNTLNTRKEICHDIQALFNQRVSAVEIAKKWSDDNAEFVVSNLWLILTDITKIKLAKNTNYIRNVYLQETMLDSANVLSISQLMKCVDFVAESLKQLRGPYNLNVLCVLEEIGLRLYNIR